MFFSSIPFLKKRLALGLLLLVLITSGLKPLAVSSAQGFPTPAESLAASQSGFPTNQAGFQTNQAGFQTNQSGFQTNQSGFQTNQIIIKYKPSSSEFAAPSRDDQMVRLSNAAGMPLQYLRAMSGDANVLLLPERLPLTQVQAISAQLMALPEVEYAEPDQIRFPALTPNDPYYSNQWDLYAINGINAPAAWDITTGSDSIVVADIDTGITNHADLSGRTVAGYDFINDVQVANDGSGRDANPADPGDWITLAESRSGYFSGCPVANSSWHGTHTAGTIGAGSNNALGVTGINWNSKILPVRVLGKCGGYDSDIIDGLRWAAGLPVTGVGTNANPARVANLSLGGSGACPAGWQSAINSVTAAGMVVVVAAGNNSADAGNFTPASCNGVITVAATNRNGSRAFYSNYGPDVEISAPGGELIGSAQNGILSTLNTGTTSPQADTYAYYQGTSMATPHVTGVVSLMLSVNPALSPAQVVQILQETARPFPAGSSCNTSICGSGMLDAAAAVSKAETVLVTRFYPACGLPGSTITVNGMHFSAASAVLFNGVNASFTVLSGTTIHATVPELATNGPISVIVPEGTATSSASFVVGACQSFFLPLVLR